MTIRIRVTPEAETDISEVYIHYERARSGLGERFSDALRERLAQVAKHPLASRDEVVLLACFHVRREPSAWKIRGRRYVDE